MPRKFLVTTKLDREINAEYNWIDYYSMLEKGSIGNYPTRRSSMLRALNIGDLMYLRISGDNDVKLIGRVYRVYDDLFQFEVIETNITRLPASEIFNIFNVKANAEFAWLEENV